MDYDSVGVSLRSADRWVKWLRGQKSSLHHDRILSDIGGFASLFKIDFPKMKEPCLASATDGVGTKLKLAAQFSSFENLGQDLVAMCVNDLICVGADPLFFLDYYACDQLQISQAQALLKGLHKACLKASCSLIGGETAEMPGIYQKGDFDLAGFAVGVVDQENIIGASQIQKKDRLIALASQGFHSNGYSLLRKIFQDDLDQWKDELLRPTALYVSVFQKILKNKIHGLAHITGGGLNNILRSVPQGSSICLKPWKVPQPFKEVQKRSGMDWKNLLSVLNCGVGMVALVDPRKAPSLVQEIKNFGIDSWDMGEVSQISSGSSCWNLDFSKWKEMNE